jgi:hypothetical protein
MRQPSLKQALATGSVPEATDPSTNPIMLSCSTFPYITILEILTVIISLSG